MIVVLFKLIHFSMMVDWEHDSASGYYYSRSNGIYYDPNSGFYYSDAIGIELNY